MNLGFHTISLLLHDETTALQQLSEIGFRSVAIRPRLSGLNPGDTRFAESMLRLADAAKRTGTQIVVETNAPFICAARLASSDAAESQVAKAWIETWLQAVAEYFGNDTVETIVTFESGTTNQNDPAAGLSVDESELERFATCVDSLLSRAIELGVRLAIRPRHGHLIAKVTHFQRLQQWLGGSHPLSFAADTGAMMLSGEFPIGERLGQQPSSLACVFLTDPETTTGHLIREPHASHLPGRVDLNRVVQSLARREIHVPLIVQIDGHSEQGMAIARQTWTNLS